MFGRQLIHKDREYLIQFVDSTGSTVRTGHGSHYESWTITDYINDVNGVPMALCLEGNWIPWHQIHAFRPREDSDATNT